MLSIVTLVAVALTLLPVAVLLVVRAHADRPVWEVALDVPLGVALDLVTLLVATRVVPLETAILASRAIWLLVGVGLVLRRRSRGAPLAWPRAIGVRDVAAVAASAASAAAICMMVSRPYRVGDHNWHDGLVPSIAGQTLPFMNVYDPKAVLHYHFAGDVLAATLRALSGNVMSASLAVSLVHDVSFGLIAATTSLFMLGFGQRRFWAIAAGGVAFVLNGPVALRGDIGPPFHGFSYFNYALASCRPHMALAGLLTAGFVGAVFAGLAHPSARRFPLLVVLVATSAALGVADEATFAALGLGLAAVWLVRPSLLARSRWVGLGVLVALLGVVLLVNFAFSAALFGGQVSKVQAVAPRLTSVTGLPSLPLSKGPGRLSLFMDTLPFSSSLVGLGILAIQRRARGLSVFLAMSFVVVAFSVVVAVVFEFNRAPWENQRFFVVPFFVTVLPCLWLLHRARRARTAAVAMALGVVAPAFFTLNWFSAQIQKDIGGEPSVGNPAIRYDLNEVDCRQAAGAKLGERPAPRYLESSEFFLLLSCRSVYAAGSVRAPWTMKIAPRHGTFSQLEELDGALVGRDETAEALCLADRTGATDPICARATANRAKCSAEGRRFLRCPLTPADRSALLADPARWRERAP